MAHLFSDSIIKRTYKFLDVSILRLSLAVFVYVGDALHIFIPGSL